MADSDHIGPFPWNAKSHRAALLVAEDELSDRAIAKKVGISKSTLELWKQHGEFAAQIGDHIGQLQAGMFKLAIAKKHKRLEVLNTLHDACLQIIEDRANRFIAEMGDIPHQNARRAAYGNHIVDEALTGLLTKKETPTNRGGIVTEWTTDIGLLKEIRALQEQAAKELGQWVERSEIEQRTSVVQLIGVEAEMI